MAGSTTAGGQTPGGGWGAPPGRRAPRLAPDERIASLMTRSGRFAKVDPLVAKPLPTLPRVLGVLGWAALTIEALRRARRARRAAAERAAGAA